VISWFFLQEFSTTMREPLPLFADTLLFFELRLSDPSNECQAADRLRNPQ
jgi:hypothetical protein